MIKDVDPRVQGVWSERKLRWEGGRYQEVTRLLAWKCGEAAPSHHPSSPGELDQAWPEVTQSSLLPSQATEVQEVQRGRLRAI